MIIGVRKANWVIEVADIDIAYELYMVNSRTAEVGLGKN
jgi:hypothetical protein